MVANNKTVADPSPRVAELEAKRKMVRAIMGGTEHLRQFKEYLPQHPAESDGVYKQRVKRAFLNNFVGKAVDKANGKIFAKEIAVSEAPAEIENLLENVDRQGNALHPFTMNVSEQAFQDGVSFILVDVPKSEGVQTLADEKRLGIRPYAIHIKAEQVLEALVEMVEGVAMLTRVRIMEHISEPGGGWEYSEFDQVKVWRMERTNTGNYVWWEIYRQNDRKEWESVGSGVTSFKRIHLIPLYTNRVGVCEGEPPFQDIAESTIEHWQWKSEHAHALSMCCFGMYTAVGVPDDFPLQVGPAKSHIATSPDAKFGVLETTGTGVSLAAEELKAIEARIDQAGVNLRVENAGKVTATAAALDSEETVAALKAIAKGYSDALEYMLQAFAEIMGLDPNNAGEVKVNDDFGAKKGTDAGLVEVGKARALGDISRPNYIRTLKWRGELPEEFDIEANEEELSAEEPALGAIGNSQGELTA